jgi:hypothetical protein
MEIALQVLLGAAAGGAAGLVAGFLAAVLTLQARFWRNGRLIARGEPGIKDCVLPLPLIVLCAIVSSLGAAGLAPWLPLIKAAAIAAALPSLLLLVVGVGAAVAQAR